MPVGEVLKGLDSQPSGLKESDARRLLAEHGPNKLQGRKRTSPAVLFFRQFLSPLIYVLCAAAVISVVVEHYLDACVILGVLLLNAIIGFAQELQAGRAMEALLKMAAPRAQVRRNAKTLSIPAEDLVPGDIVLLETGNRVPADARVIQQTNLKVNEASLTGESVPVEKETEPVSESATVSERTNTVFLGTIVAYGRAAAVVVATGMNTELGKIASSLQEVQPEQTPVQKSIAALSRYLIVLVLSIVTVLLVVGLLRGLDRLEIFLLAIAASVSAIPEGLPAVVTVVLAIGMRQMANRNALVRRLVAVETLGSATVICSDKTGTLTMNEMTVRRIYADGRFVDVSGEGYSFDGEFLCSGKPLAMEGNPTIGLLLKTGAFCNDASVVRNEEEYEVVGDPTEAALVVAAAKAEPGRSPLQLPAARQCEIPFESEQQYMAVGYPHDAGVRVYVKGAAERVLAMSGTVMSDGRVTPISPGDREAIATATTSLAAEAMRVIALAYVDLPGTPRKLTGTELQGSLTFLGLAGMADPPRDEARRAMARCIEAGIRVIMITGDHKVTAQAIARELALPEGRAIDGSELAAMSDEELARDIGHISVFARIEPLHKLRIVNALKRQGHVVAMTGDGVNDAPALKTASIGIAMGRTGTDVAKEASDMVLADDNFATVVAAIEEGRAIFTRLRNVVFFLLSTNMGELLALILSVAIVGKAPLLAVQIIWVNLVTETACAIPLGLEPKVGDELRQPPRDPRVGLLYPGLVFRITFLACMMGIGVFAVFLWAQARMPLDEARTVAFCTLVTFGWFRAFNARSDEHTLFSLGLFTNKVLLASISVAIMLQMGVVYLPAGQAAFGTVPLGMYDWAVALSAGGALFIAEETRKLVAPRLFSLGKWQPVRKARSGSDR